MIEASTDASPLASLLQFHYIRVRMNKRWPSKKIDRAKRRKPRNIIIIDVDTLTNKTCEFTLTTRKRGSVTASLQQNDE